MAGKKKLIIANWKMNPGKEKDALTLFVAVKEEAALRQNIQTVICPPFPFISVLKKNVSGRKCSIGAQNMHWEVNGAYTGEISSAMLLDYGIKYVLVGHSERRAFGETDEMVNKKLLAALRRGMSPVLLVGETERDSAGAFFNVVRDQITRAFEGAPRHLLKNIVLVYEPVWAISSHAALPCSPENILEMHIFIKKVLNDLLGSVAAGRLPILYGGSVNPENAGGIIAESGVTGFVVGNASLDTRKFARILEIADKMKPLAL
ncbi:triose-phosphate isomerase [bacterium]|nr:triose-phosphate isomerase [bacterium]MCI0566413.1 triose-phosphate isomerase [bacterium]